MRRVDLASRWSRLRAGVVLGLCGFALLGWQGVTTLGHNGPIDAGEHLAYAEYLATHWRLPSKAQNYEYASPPLFQATAVAAEKIVRELPSAVVETPSNPLTRALWAVLVGAGVLAMTSARRRTRVAGAASLGVAVLWGIDEAISLCRSEEWSAGQLISLACGAGLIVVTGLIAREAWPGSPRRALAAGGFAAAYPVVYRMSILFHPEIPFAFLCALALLVTLRAVRLGWPGRLGWALGAACGAAAVTRAPAILLIACLGLAIARLGGRSSRGFLTRAAVVVVVIAGPWWVYGTYRWHNPLQSNLQLRPALMMASQPASFYFSAPLRSLVVHPYRPDFTDALLPKLHADLWSDWFGALHESWASPTTAEKVTASTQSVLGFAGDLLTLAGLAALAAPAAIRVARRRSREPADVALGLLALIAIVAFAGFLVTLLRFPQRDGDPIKTSYLLFTTPCWAIFAVAAWAWIRERHRAAHAVLVGVAVLYVASYGAALASGLDTTSGASNTGQLPGVVDLQSSFQQNSPNPGIGGPIDFLAGVADNGGKSATGVRLTIRLPPGMKLLGVPFTVQGSGCTGMRTITCDLAVIDGGSSTYARFSVEVDRGGPLTMTADATSDETDARPSDNVSSFTVDLGPP